MIAAPPSPPARATVGPTSSNWATNHAMPDDKTATSKRSRRSRTGLVSSEYSQEVSRLTDMAREPPPTVSPADVAGQPVNMAIFMMKILGWLARCSARGGPEGARASAEIFQIWRKWNGVQNRKNSSQAAALFASIVLRHAHDIPEDATPDDLDGLARNAIVHFGLTYLDLALELDENLVRIAIERSVADARADGGTPKWQAIVDAFNSSGERTNADALRKAFAFSSKRKP